MYLVFDSWAIHFMDAHHLVQQYKKKPRCACAFLLVRLWYMVYSRFMFCTGSHQRRVILA